MASTNQGIIIVSTKEHENSWNRHNPLSMLKKVVINTDVRFNTNLSSLTGELRIKELKTEVEKLFSPRGISLLFQQLDVSSPFILSFIISSDDFLQALGDKEKSKT